MDNGVPTTGPVRGEVCHVYLPPATQLYYVNNTVMVSAKQTMSVSRLQQWRMEDKKPNKLEKIDEFVGNHEEKMFQSLLCEMEDQEKSYLGIRVNPSSRQPARAQCGVMRAAATHTTTKPNSREQFCSAECRQQTAVPRGQSVGQLGSKDEEDLQEDSRQDPQEDPQERPRELPSSGPRSLDESTKYVCDGDH